MEMVAGEAKFRRHGGPDIVPSPCVKSHHQEPLKVNVSGRKASKRIDRLGRAGHCCCLISQLPALVLTLASSTPTLMAWARGSDGAVSAQLAPGIRLLRSVEVLAITLHE